MNESSIYRNVSYYIIILYRIILSFTYFLQLHLFWCNINCMISLTSFAILYFSPDSHWREIHSWPKISKAFYNRLENFFDTFSFFVLIFREISMGSYFKLFPFCLIQAKIFIEKRKKKEKEEMKVVKIILDSNQLLLLLARFVRELAPLFRFPSGPTLFLLFSSSLAMDLLNYVWLTVKVHWRDWRWNFGTNHFRIEEDWFCFEIRIGKKKKWEFFNILLFDFVRRYNYIGI